MSASKRSTTINYIRTQKYSTETKLSAYKGENVRSLLKLKVAQNVIIAKIA
jgi:hypothetical protein